MNGSQRSGKSTYVCTTCGHHAAKWMGFCPQCRTQEPLVETLPTSGSRSGAQVDVVAAVGREAAIVDRHATGVAEFDRVLGGGIVPGAALLLGGEPGVGKSTLLLQIADRVATEIGPVLIATAEESPHQVQMRARRVGVASEGVAIASVRDVDDIVSLARDRAPSMLVVDSIQTISSAEVGGSAGGVSQVREAASRLIAHAKSTDTPVVLVGHVTKDGSIAGPRMLEHMVDVVLYLEGDNDHGLRFLRGTKNRYGSVNEIGIFEMTSDGLVEVPDPSGVLTAGRDGGAPGSVLFPTVEGRRPMMVEIQALVVDTRAEQPRRAVTGYPAGRVHQVLGVLERHAGIHLGRSDVYVSVMGGVRLTEPAADLAVALAVASASSHIPMHRTVAWGELGLTGDVRPANRSALRRAEAERIAAGPIIAPPVEGESATRLFEVLVECGLGSAIR